MANLSFGVLDGKPLDSGGFNAMATVQQRAVLVATVTADANALSMTTSSWSHCMALFVTIPPQWNNVKLSFYGYGDGTGAGDPNNATFSYDVHLCDLFSGAITVSVGNTGVIGAQQISHNPTTGVAFASGAVDPNYCWADTLAAGTIRPGWSISWFDNLGNNCKAETSFDRRSAYGIYVRIYNMTAQPVTSITCVMNGY